MYFDSHAHYNDSKFDYDRFTVLDSLPSLNVGAVIVPGCSIADSEASLKLSESYDYVYSAVGIHPEELPDDFETAFALLSNMAKHVKCVAIGEIGLDYYWDDTKKKEQRIAFERQLELALELKLPVIIHDREAHGDCLDTVKRYPGLKGVFHCYSGSAEMAAELLKLGWFLGFDGPVTYKNARKSIEVLEICPTDRMLVETDSPYLPPVPERGNRNHSGNLKYIVEKIAEIKGKTPEYIENVTSENAKVLFGIK